MSPPSEKFVFDDRGRTTTDGVATSAILIQREVPWFLLLHDGMFGVDRVDLASLGVGDVITEV